MSRPRAFSGIQPTADSFHLGNYLGAVRQWVALQDTHDAVYCVVDLHAITVPQDPALLRHRTRVAAAQLFAAGLDPDRCTVFVQSQVPEHTELAWVLGCLTGFGEASRMTQFKDKAARGGAQQASLGLFSYPVLQAIRFNHRFGPTFAVPAAYILGGVAKINDLQEPRAKMSKSASSPAGIIDLLDEPGVVRKKIARAVTDAGSEIRSDDAEKPGVSNLLRIYSALSGEEIADLEARYAGAGYGAFKKDLAEVVAGTLAPIRERAEKMLADEAELDRMLGHGAAKARPVATQTMAAVRERVGFLPAGDAG
jgi:tryptophanyl-tRNA synthetase